MCPDMSPTFIGIVPCTKYIPTKVLISKAHSKMHPRSPWEALFWMCLRNTSATGLYSLTGMRWDDISNEMEGAAASPLEKFLCLKTARPDVPQSRGREVWRWHVNGEELVSLPGRLQSPGGSSLQSGQEFCRTRLWGDLKINHTDEDRQALTYQPR